MAIENLQETWRTCTLTKNTLTTKISELQSQKTLAAYQQGDIHSIKAQEEEEIRNKYKAEYENDAVYQEKYRNYTDIPDFEEEMDKIAAEYQDQLADLTGWETQIDTQITTASAELEEVNAYEQFVKSTLSSNIEGDFSYGSVGN